MNLKLISESTRYNDIRIIFVTKERPLPELLQLLKDGKDETLNEHYSLELPAIKDVRFFKNKFNIF